MPQKRDWIEQKVVPAAMILVGVYGFWDVVIKPSIKPTTASLKVCTDDVAAVTLEQPTSSINSTPEARSTPPPGLPIPVKASQTVTIKVPIVKSEDKQAHYQWKALYGQVRPQGLSSQNRVIYTAPKELINDTISVKVMLPGCHPIERSLAVAIVPSSTPTTTPNPFEENSTPSTLPLPEPTFSPSPNF